MQTAVGRHPDAAVPRLEHGVDLAQSGLHRRPDFSIELVDYFSAGTPDIAFACLQQLHGSAAAKFLYGQKRPRLLVPDTQAEAGTQTQSAVFGRLHEKDFIAESPVRVRLEKRRETLPIEYFEAKMPGRTLFDSLGAKPAVSEFSREGLDSPTGRCVNR